MTATTVTVMMTRMTCFQQNIDILKCTKLQAASLNAMQIDLTTILHTWLPISFECWNLMIRNTGVCQGMKYHTTNTNKNTDVNIIVHNQNYMHVNEPEVFSLNYLISSADRITLVVYLPLSVQFVMFDLLIIFITVLSFFNHQNSNTI